MDQAPGALHLARFMRPRLAGEPGTRRVPAGGGRTSYLRWGGFYHGLLACRVGKTVATLADLHRLIGDSPEAGEVATSIVVMSWIGTRDNPVPAKSIVYGSHVGEQIGWPRPDTQAPQGPEPYSRPGGDDVGRGDDTALT